MRKKREVEIEGYSELDELITRIFFDPVPYDKKPDIAYLFGETVDEEDSVLKAGAALYDTGAIKKIAHCGARKGHAFSGKKNWSKKLHALGIPFKDIYPIPLSKKFPPSTHAESFGLVSYARKQGWKKIYIVAPPLHQLRAFVTTVSAIIKEKSHLRVYSFTGLPQNWEERIAHSQKPQKRARHEFFGDEFKKIEKYYQKGDLVSGKEILKYLEKRDK